MISFAGHLTTLSDVYSFGVVLLELLTGRRSMDKNRPSREQNLVDWARPSLNDAQKLKRIMDPRLEGQYSPKAAEKAAALAYQCLSRHAKSRPTMSTVVKTLEPLQDMLDDMPIGPFIYTVTAENGKDEDIKEAAEKEKDHKNHDHRDRPCSPMLATAMEGHMRKATAKENGYHRYHHHLGKRHRTRSPSAVAALSSFSDTALYKKYGNHRKRKQSKAPAQGIV